MNETLQALGIILMAGAIVNLGWNLMGVLFELAKLGIEVIRGRIGDKTDD